jgi:hypothetical protein
MIFRKDEKPDTQEVICFINQEGDLYIGEKDDVFCYNTERRYTHIFRIR